MLVPQYIGHFFQRCSTLNKACRCSTPQHVDAMKSLAEAGANKAASDEVGDGTGADRLVVWRYLPDKYGAITGVWASVL